MIAGTTGAEVVEGIFSEAFSLSELLADETTRWAGLDARLIRLRLVLFRPARRLCLAVVLFWGEGLLRNGDGTNSVSWEEDSDFSMWGGLVWEASIWGGMEWGVLMGEASSAGKGAQKRSRWRSEWRLSSVSSNSPKAALLVVKSRHDG
jgi:hypothetical protein